MPEIEALHPPADRLAVYAQGLLDESEMAEIEDHLGLCDSCCQLVRDQPDDSFVAKLRGRTTAIAAAPVTEQESADEPPAGFQIASSLILGPTDNTALHDKATVAGPPAGSPDLAGLPPELSDHPRYRVVAAIGVGGMGSVYRAEHKLMDRPVALKVIRGDLLGKPALVERFRREVKSAARLASHPNIVAAYDAEQAGETHMLVMEFIEGTDLAHEVERRGPLPVGEACEYARQAAQGLQHAFEDGMVHRDIKPQNLMRTTRGQIKILDFGLARFASEFASHGGLTSEGMVLGSADYIAPEQIQNPHDADVRADIYSLGCTLYFLLTGRPPFPGGSLIQKLLAHRETTPRPLTELRADVPPDLSRFVERMMAKDPSHRPSTPAEAVLALAPFSDAFQRGRQSLDSPERDSAAVGETKSDRCVTVIEPLLSDSALDEGTRRPPPTVVQKQRRFGPRIRRAAAGLLMLALVIACGVILRFKTANGLMELVNLPRDAEVLVDGDEVAVTWPGGGKPAIVTITPGKHRIKVRKDGIETSGDEVTVRAGEREKFTVRLVTSTKTTDQFSKVHDVESIRNSIGMTLNLIPAGDFFMGSPDDAMEAEGHEKPLHRVRISKAFYLGVTEVTQAQYEAVMGSNPSQFAASGGGKDRVAGQPTDQFPVEYVSWLDVIQFCNKLSEKEGKKPFYEIDGPDIRVLDWNEQGYRLPTEAEWEYACRANASSPARFSYGDNPLELGIYGWIDGNSEQRTHPVSRKRPNGFGLYDMHGNVFEWCWDGWSEAYYTQSPGDDPTGSIGGSGRVLRGGGWSDPPRLCRSPYRIWRELGVRGDNIGFRLALSQSGHLPREFPKEESIGSIQNSVGMTLNLIPAGEFFMGSPDDAMEAGNEEKPLHRVRISKPFYMGVCEVTQGQYEAVIGKNPSYFCSIGGGKDQVGGDSTDQYPVENVFWLDAIQFCNKLSEKEGKKPFYRIDGKDVRVPDWSGQGYRLPTEAEWEYACRANAAATTRFSFGDNPLDLESYGWFEDNSERRTHPVSKKRPNAFGLYDMHGNVWEWCWDGVDLGYYNRSPTDDPTGPAVALDRFVRGGSWNGDPRLARSAERFGSGLDFRWHDLGFRLVLGRSGR